MFKTVLRGFDKDEVLVYIQQLQDELNLAKTEKEKAINERDKIIRDLKSRISQKDEQRAQLENEIETKYKKYIDNYEKIGSLIFESQVKGDKMVAEAKAEADMIKEESQSASEKMLSEAREKAEFIRTEAQEEADKARSEANADAAYIREKAEKESAEVRGSADAVAEAAMNRVQIKIDEAIDDGKAKYARIQSVLDDTLKMFSKIQQSFLVNYREVNQIVEDAGTTLADLELARYGGGKDPVLKSKAESEMKMAGNETEVSADTTADIETVLDEECEEPVFDIERVIWEKNDATDEIVLPNLTESIDTTKEIVLSESEKAADGIENAASKEEEKDNIDDEEIRESLRRLQDQLEKL